MIIDGCVAFAKKVGSTRIEAELLPQCWEQVSQFLEVECVLWSKAVEHHGWVHARAHWLLLSGCWLFKIVRSQILVAVHKFTLRF